MKFQQPKQATDAAMGYDNVDVLGIKMMDTTTEEEFYIGQGISAAQHSH